MHVNIIHNPAEKKPWEPRIWNNLLILMMKKQPQRFEVISSKSQRSSSTSIYVISSRAGIRMDPYFFGLDCNYKKNCFIPWYLTKFHLWHTSFTLHIHLGQPHLPPIPSTIILLSHSQICISCPVKLLVLYTKCSVAHLISPTAVQVSQLSHAEKSNSYFPHILL